MPLNPVALFPWVDFMASCNSVIVKSTVLMGKASNILVIGWSSTTGGCPSSPSKCSFHNFIYSLCKCGQADQTPDHVLQPCPKYAKRRQLTWPQGADLATKLWGSAEDLYQTAGFMASTGLKIWPAQLSIAEEEFLCQTRKQIAISIHENWNQLYPLILPEHSYVQQWWWHYASAIDVWHPVSCFKIWWSLSRLNNWRGYSKK